MSISTMNFFSLYVLQNQIYLLIESRFLQIYVDLLKSMPPLIHKCTQIFMHFPASAYEEAMF